MADSFYASIEPVDSFERLALPASYRTLPDGWSLVAADVVDSTAAIESGRYKNVNTVGVSVIAAVRNAVRPIDVPYVFGGDGALVCIPDRFVSDVRRSLAAMIAMAQESFGLALRLVLSGTSAQRAELDRYLAELRDAGRVAYGLHVARSALMTCLIEERQGAHFHFVDASGGGYAAAALALKRGR